MTIDVQAWNPEKISLIQRVIAPSVSKDEFDMFIARCKQTGLDPIARQIYAISRYDRQVGGNKMSIQVSIDGMRLLAERSGKYAGQLGPLFCGKDGKEWCEVWTSSEPPYAAKVGILRSDFQQPLWSVAKYGEYVQTNKDGHPLSLWAKMPDLMLAKCAESLALRRAFPYETSGLYTREEMGQADNEVVISEVSETKQAHTLKDVQEFFSKYFKPGQWRGFKRAEVGPVEDEALTDDELDILYKRLMVIDEDQKRRKAEPVAATSGK